MDKLKIVICDDSITVRERLVSMIVDLPEVDVVWQAEDAPGSLEAILGRVPTFSNPRHTHARGQRHRCVRKVKQMTPASEGHHSHELCLCPVPEGI